jgi:hypothetical protein
MIGLSNLSTFAPPADRSDLMPEEAIRLTRQSLLCPMYPGLSAAGITRLAEALHRAAHKKGTLLGIQNMP